MSDHNRRYELERKAKHHSLTPQEQAEYQRLQEEYVEGVYGHNQTSRLVTDWS